MIEPQGTLYIHQNWYDVDTTKLTSAKDIAELITAMEMKVSPTTKNFDKVKHLLIIPEEPKGLEYYQQELDEKFEKLIEQTKRNFYASKLTAERNYEYKFDRIIDNFEYARKNGFFPVKYPLSETFDCTTLSVNCGVNIGSPRFVVKNGSSHQGYYTIGDDGYYRFYMEKKPNVIFRWFVYKLMGFRWVDEKFL